MTIFDYLKSILVTKNKKVLCDTEYVPFMVNRWLSFLTPGSALNINESVNSYYIEDKSIHYKYLLSLFPKLKTQPRINYIKKSSKKKEKEDENISMMSVHLEMSTRELRDLISFQNSLKK